MMQRTGIEVTFLGAAGEVTGSCYRVAAGGAQFLVECGMFQGGRDADDRKRPEPLAGRMPPYAMAAPSPWAWPLAACWRWPAGSRPNG